MILFRLSKEIKIIAAALIRRCWGSSPNRSAPAIARVVRGRPDKSAMADLMGKAGVQLITEVAIGLCLGLLFLFAAEPEDEP